MANVGLTIVEGISNGASGYREPSKRNVGLIGQFVRGAVLTPTRITSLDEFNSIFGGQTSSNYYGPATVRAIFKEAGNAPVTLYIARVVGDGALPANNTLTYMSKTMTIKAGYKGVEDVGTWANGTKVRLYSYGYKMRDLFTLEVVTKEGLTETFSADTIAGLAKYVNQLSRYITIQGAVQEPATKVQYESLSGTISVEGTTVTGSSSNFTTALSEGTVLFVNSSDTPRYVGTVLRVESDTRAILTGKLTGEPIVSATISKRVDNVYETTLSGGNDGADIEADVFTPVEHPTSPKGLACFDGYDVQVIAMTELHSIKTAKILNAYLDKHKNPIGVVSLPLESDANMAELYALELQKKQGTSFLHGAFMQWCWVNNDDGSTQLIPAIGPVIGAAFIRTPYTQGDFIHIPPGGIDGVFYNVVSVEPARLSRSTINKMVQELSCNYINYVEGIGFYVGSSRMYTRDSLYVSTHIRLQTSYYLRVLNSKLRFLEQKPNTPELKREALIELRQFFQGEYDKGALERSVGFETAYIGICDKSNNPPTQDRKLINISVQWIPTECTESIQVELQRNDGVLTITEK